jgi:hypothetical protein
MVRALQIKVHKSIKLLEINRQYINCKKLEFNSTSDL